MIKRQMKLGTALLFGLTGAMIQGAHSLSSTMMKPMLKQHLLFFSSAISAAGATRNVRKIYFQIKS